MNFQFGEKMDEGSSFLAFRAKLWACFEVPPGDNWEGGPAVGVLYDIVEGEARNYVFDFAHMRTTQDLLLGAILLNDWKQRNVVFLTPTTYYAMQAVRFAHRYEQAGVVASVSRLTIGVAGNIPLATLKAANAIFHHGRVYPLPPEIELLPTLKTVIQIFPDEQVPHDTRPLSSLMCHYDNNE